MIESRVHIKLIIDKNRELPNTQYDLFFFRPKEGFYIEFYRNEERPITP